MFKSDPLESVALTDLMGAKAVPGNPAQVTAREELRQAADRQSSSAVPRMTWHLMVEALEFTALAASAEHQGDDSEAALLAACAAGSVRRAAMALPLEGRSPHGAARSVHLVVVGGPIHRVRRTSARLAGLLLGARPTDPDLVRRALEAHTAALDTWRVEQLAAVRRSHALAG
ncbi:MAG: hypothetical protein QOC70_2983 [Verrucomicrobiota bacterium]|jgi:hypothetical protein